MASVNRRHPPWPLDFRIAESDPYRPPASPDEDWQEANGGGIPITFLLHVDDTHLDPLDHACLHRRPGQWHPTRRVRRAVHCRDGSRYEASTTVPETSLVTSNPTPRLFFG